MRGSLTGLPGAQSQAPGAGTRGSLVPPNASVGRRGPDAPLLYLLNSVGVFASGPPPTPDRSRLLRRSRPGLALPRRPARGRRPSASRPRSRGLLSARGEGFSVRSGPGGTAPPGATEECLSRGLALDEAFPP